MKRFELFKWPLTYLVIIVAIIAYINREALFEAPTDESAGLADEFASVDIENEAVEGTALEGTDTTVELNAAEPVASQEEAVTEPAGESVDSVVDTTLPAVSGGTDSLVSAQANTTLPPTPDSAGATLEPGQLWQQARAQVWSGEYEQAIEQYQQLLELQPANYDAHGELGDLYLGMRRYEEAGGSYLEAGRQLVAAGYGQSAWRLLPMLNDIAPDKAEELRRLLRPQAPTDRMAP